MANFSTGDKIGLYGLLFAFIAIVISLTTPEIRKYLGLENDTSTTDELTDKLSKKEIAYILIARGIQEGTLTQKEIDRWIRTLDDNNAIQIIDSLYFVDQTIHGIVNKNEIDELYDKKVKGGFNPPEPLELDCDNKLLYVNTCREYFKIPDNCGPSNGYMEKELHWYDISCTILKAVKDGIRAKKSCLPQNLLEELPQSFINIGFSEEGETTEKLFSEDKKKIKGLGLKQEGNKIDFQQGEEFACALTELMRTDINSDGFEDVLVNKWFWTGGSMTLSELWWLTSKEIGKMEILNIK